jgi:hypothetical protein
MHAVPYSLVPVVRGHGFQFDTNANSAGLTPMQQFTKDEAADPHRTGGTTFTMAPAGTTWEGRPEPASRQESLQRQAQADKTAPLPQQLLTGAMKGGGTIARPVIDVANLGMGDKGDTPQETSAMLEGQTPTETAAKVGTIGATIAPGLVYAPVPTATGLAGGAIGSYAAGKIADGLGADPKLSAVVSDVGGLAGGVGGSMAVRPSAVWGAAGQAPLAGAEGPVNTMSGVNSVLDAAQHATIPSAFGAAGRGLKTALTGDIHAPIPGTDITPAGRYQAMKDMGLTPNAAEATNAPILKAVERVNKNSLTAAGTYADAQANNLAALNDFTEHLLNGMSETSPEEGGAAVQQGLRAAQVKLQNSAGEGFSNLDRQVGNRKMQGRTIQQTAQNIYDAYKDYADKYPELVPKDTWKLVKRLAGADTTPPFRPQPVSFSEVHQLRSDLLELVRSNPDIVKNQAGGWLQQLAEAADATMTTGKSGLTPQQVQVFRDANEAWAKMKSIYDNPSHPFYQALRNPSPSKLVDGISATPEMAKMLQEALGPEGMGPIQRGIAEKLLRTTRDGGYNFKTFQGQWNRLPESYREAVFTPEQRQQLEGIAEAGTVLNTEPNPSGSARLGQGIAEGAEALKALASPSIPELGGNAIYHGAHYGVGKLMNSPWFVDWLMKGRGFTRMEDAGAAPVAPVDPRTGPLGQPNYYSN